MKELTPFEKAPLLAAYFKDPQAHMKPVVIDDPKNPGSPLIATQIEGGPVIGQDGQVVPDAKPYEKTGNLTPGAFVDYDGKTKPYLRDPKRPGYGVTMTGQVLDEFQMANILPSAAYLPTVTSTTKTEPSAVADPTAPGGVRIGPAITSQSTSTHQKQTPKPSGPPSRPGATGGPPTREQATSGGAAPTAKSGGLPFAAPKDFKSVYNQKVGTYKQSEAEANKELAAANKELENLKKEKRKSTSGITGGMFNADVPTQEAEAKVKAAKKKAALAKVQADYLERMRESVASGIVPMDVVEKTAQDMAKGIFPAK
jgi:hypothetical protein